MPTSPSDSDDRLRGSSSSIVASKATGHHLLHIDSYSRTKELAPHGKWINSRSFMAAGHSWHIMFYPNGIVTGSPDHIAVYLVLDDPVAEPVIARVTFSLLDQAGQPALAGTTLTCEFSGHGQAGFDAFVSREWLEASPHLSDDSLAIRCDVSVYDKTCTAAVPASDLHRHLGGLLAAGDCADVAFRVAGETFRAHRCILAARSPVFRAALLGPMREGGAAAAVEVEDMEAGVFGALLEFAYTDTLPEMSRLEEAAICEHLLVAADRYDMERLKLICEERLRRHIGVGSAATILALAEEHGCPGLKDACFRFLETPRALAAVTAADGGGFEHLGRSSPSIMKELIFRTMDR